MTRADATPPRSTTPRREKGAGYHSGHLKEELKRSNLAHMHSPRTAREERGVEGRGLEMQDERILWRKKPIVAETGKVYTNWVVSVRSPSFMKSPFESNRAYFDRLGISQRDLSLPTRQEKTRSAGRYQEAVEIHAENTGLKRNIKQSTGRIYAQTGTSLDAPEFMRSPFETSKHHPAIQAQSYYLGELGSRSEAAGLDAHYVGKNTKAIEQYAPNLDDSRRVLVPDVSGDTHERSHPMVTNITQPSGPIKSRPVYYANEDTGRVYHKNFPSRTSPEWMTSQYSGNEAHFTDKASKIGSSEACWTDALDSMGLSGRIPRYSLHPKGGSTPRSGCTTPRKDGGGQANASGKPAAGMRYHCKAQGDVVELQRTMKNQVLQRSKTSARPISARQPRDPITGKVTTPRRAATPR